jgi:hypothetical protein
MANKKENIIWTNNDYSEWKECMIKYDGASEEDVTLEAYYDDTDFCLDDERDNLDIDLDKVVVCFIDLGLWDGRYRAAMVCKHQNVNSIFDFMAASRSCDYFDFYCDRYNVRSRASHHDGTNYALFRLCESAEQAERVTDQWVHEKASEEKIRKRTRSLRPYVAKVYGF